MSRHPQLAKNQFGPSEARLNKKDEEWTHLAAHLNKMGSEKTVAQWKNVWKKKILDIMKSSDEESGEEEIQRVSKQPSQYISVPANPTSEEVEEPRFLSSQLNSPEPSESDSPCTSPTPCDTGPVKRRTKRSTMAQLQTLVNCMALNPSMGFGLQDSNIADWQRLTELLHTMGPPKQVFGWQQTWRHMKSKAVQAAKKKRKMKDGVPLSVMKQKIIEMITAYKGRSNALDESRVQLDELPCPTDGMSVLFARSLSPPSRLNSPDLENIGDLDNSINFQDIGLNPEMSTLSLDEDTSRLGEESPSRNSGQMSPLRYSDQSSDDESPDRHFDEVSNEQTSSNQVLKQITPSVTSGRTASKDTNQTSSMPCKNERDSNGKIVTHACNRFQKAALVDYMSTHTALATSTYKGVDTLDPNRYAEWRYLTKYLNKIGPAETTEFWKRTWDLIIRSQRVKKMSGSKEIFQKVPNIISETPNSQDNSTNMDTDAREEIVPGNVSLPRMSDQMSPERHTSGQMSPVRRNSDQMSPVRRNSSHSSPVRPNSDQTSPGRRNSGQMSPERSNSDQTSPERRNSDQTSPERRNSDQTSPERRNSGQMSPERSNSGQMFPVQPNSGQRPIQRPVIPVRCYASQVSLQGSEETSPTLNSKDLLEIVEPRPSSPTESDVELEMLATVKGPRKRRCTLSQTEFLVDFMEENVDFAINKPYTHAGHEKWRRLSKNLNKIGPPKSVQSWRTTWRNLKRNVLSRKRDNPLTLLTFSDQAILKLIEAYKSHDTEETASMNGENGQTDSSQQTRNTSELVGNARCSKAQIAALAEYMSANPVLATTKYIGPCADDPTIADWRQLIKYLNRMGVARSITGWKQIWRNIVTCVRKSQQPNDWDEKISRNVLKAVGDETIPKNHSKLTIDIVEESGQMSPVNNFNQMSPPCNTGRASPENFDQMSPIHSTGHVSPVNFEQMSPLHSTGHVSPVDFDQMSLVNIDQMSPMHNTGQVSLQSLDNKGQASVNFGQTSPVYNNRQSPVKTSQMSPVKFGQKSSGHNNYQVNSGQAGNFETSAVDMESYIEVDPPLRSKNKIMKITRSTRAQVKAIVNYMSTHPALAKGEQKGPIAVEKRQLEWRLLGKHLNRMGPTKSTDAWKHTWRDLKRSARTAKNSRGFQAQIYQQILNIMSPAKDGQIESSIDTVEEKDTLPKPRPTENISVPFARSPSPELCLNAPDPLQCDNEHSSDISRHKNSGEHSQKIESNNISTRLEDSEEHSQQISSFSEFLLSRNVQRNSVQSNNVSTRKEKYSEQMSLPPSQTNNVSARHKESIRHSHQYPVPSTSESNNISTRFKESEKMSSAQRNSGQSNNNQLFRHIETNDLGDGRERRVERSTQTRKQLNSLVDCVYAHPILASEQKTSNPRHYEWSTIGKFLNKMGPIYCTDWENRWKELKHDVARRCRKDKAYTGCIDSVRVKKVLELTAKYPTADRTDSDIEIVEDTPTQAPTTHHPTSSVQHKVIEILSRNHNVDRDSINPESNEKIGGGIAPSNVENRTAGRDFIERSKEEGDIAYSATATTNISSEDTNSLLKELIGELRRSNELKVEQNGILKQLVKQFSTDALKTNHSKKNEPQIEHVEPPVIQKREVVDLTEEYPNNTRNSERSVEHYAHTSIPDGPRHKDKVHISNVRNLAKSSERPQIPTSSKEEATSSPKKQIRITDITRLMKPKEPVVTRVVKLKTTKAPKMPKVSLLRLKDGTMVVMPGSKLPALNDEYQTFVVGSVKHVDSERVSENENEPIGFQDYEF